ncbi:MAG: DUF5412 family protein [Alkaliphilus sp.]
MKKMFTVILIIIGILAIPAGWFVVSMNTLLLIPDGEFILAVDSPNSEYTLKAYVTRPGATVANSIRGELHYNHPRKRAKNIYWSYREEHAEVYWLDNYTVVINGRHLDVRYDKYDFRRSNGN